MKINKKIFVLMVLICSVFFSINAEESDKYIAEVEFIYGDLYLLEKAEWKEIYVNEELRVGDVIKTDKDSYAEIISKDGDIKLKVGGDTKFVIKKFTKREKKVKSFFGKLWSKVKKIVGRKYEVETKFGTAGVRGTEFGVETNDNIGMNVECRTGEIYLKNNVGEEKILSAGFKSGINNEGKFKETESTDDKSAISLDENEAKKKVFLGLIKEIRDLISRLQDEFSIMIFKNLTKKINIAEKIKNDINYNFPEWDGIISKYNEFEKKANEISEEDKNLLKRLAEYEKQLEYWNSQLSVKEGNVDFRIYSERIEKFDKFYRNIFNEINDIVEDSNKTSKNNIYYKYKILLNKYKVLDDKRIQLIEIIKFEEYLFDRMKSIKYKIASFKAALENFSTQAGSVSTWISQASDAVRTGENIDQYSFEAKRWNFLKKRYESLNSQFLDYKKLLNEAKRKGVLYVSKRVKKEYEDIENLLTNFKIKKGLILVTMNFGQLQKQFLILNSFLNSQEGRSLLQ